MPEMLSPKQTFEAFFSRLLNHADNWRDLIANEATMVTPLINIQGKDKLILLYKTFYQTVQEKVIHQLVEKGDFVIARVSTTTKGNTGKTIRLKANEWYTIQEGKIVAIRIHFDTAVVDGL